MEARFDVRKDFDRGRKSGKQNKGPGREPRKAIKERKDATGQMGGC